ncbi:hypothetical protein [Legionella sp. W05-934-2]|uniref:hypothetical protein n=1 Tax=Legionella sp. W05-934-2 TaxID=1198649 RepID=UPI003461CA85
MANKPPVSRWAHVQPDNLVNNKQAPVISEDQIKDHYLNTQKGSPVDTKEEGDAQGLNLGAVDTKAEKMATEPENSENSGYKSP